MFYFMDYILFHILIGAGTEKAPELEEHPPGNVTEQKEVPLSVDGFWSGEELESFSVNISPPDVSAAIIKRLMRIFIFNNILR